MHTQNVHRWTHGQAHYTLHVYQYIRAVQEMQSIKYGKDKKKFGGYGRTANFCAKYTHRKHISGHFHFNSQAKQVIPYYQQKSTGAKWKHKFLKDQTQIEPKYHHYIKANNTVGTYQWPPVQTELYSPSNLGGADCLFLSNNLYYLLNTELELVSARPEPSVNTGRKK